jgi:ATP synthase protein I
MTPSSDGPSGADGHPGPTGPKTDGDLAERRERLSRELKRRSDLDSAEDDGTRKSRSDASGLALALRVGSEFIAAVIVGGFIGWGVDRLAGSAPWGMIVFLTLGFVAGVMNVMRSTGLQQGRTGSDGRGS